MADFTAGNVLTAAQLDTAFNTFTINDETGTTYTLGAADAGEMVSIANNSGGTVTIPLNATVPFETGTHVSILNAGTAGTYTVAATGGVTLNGSVTSLAPGEALTAIKTATNTWRTLAGGLGKASVSATTGSPSVDSSTRPGKTIYTFTGSGSITVSKAGTAEILVAGGGGAGGGRSNGYCGGGGAGGVLIDLGAYLAAGTLTVTVGAGGAASADNRGRAGNTSSVGSYFSTGGGGGGGTSGAWLTVGGVGGSGGGGQGSTAEQSAGGAGTTGLGYAGGNSGSTTSGGGGGGASAAAGNSSGTTGSAGGAGVASTITGASVTYGGGGGGAGSGVNGAGGAGGGGAAGATGTAGTANTGGGGGGIAFTSNSPGAGGSGVVIIVIG